MEFYNPQQLSQIYGDWNPEMYMQGRSQVESSNQAQASARTLEAERAKQAGLETLFKEQSNPITIQQNQANLQGTLYDNMSKGVKGRLDVATEPFKLDDAKRAQALAMPEHEIKMMQAKGEQWAMSDDPALATKGKNILMKSRAAIEARQKHAEEMEKQNLIRSSAERIAAANRAAQLEATKVRAAPKAGGGADFWSSFYKQRNPAVQHSALIAEATKIAQDNPEEAAKMMQMAEAIRPQVEAALNAPKPGQMAPPPGIGTLPPASIAPPAGARPQGSSGAGDLKSLVEQQGGSFDPQRFEYRVNPVTGKVQSRPKG